MKKKTYTAPLVELLDARVEKGYQATGGTTNPSNGGERVTNSGHNYSGNALFN